MLLLSFWGAVAPGRAGRVAGGPGTPSGSKDPANASRRPCRAGRAAP